MIQPIINYFSQKFLSRWIVLTIDVIFVWILFYFSVLVRFNFEFSNVSMGMIHERSSFVLIVYTLLFLTIGSYKGIIRQTGLIDAFLLFKACSYSMIILFSFGIIPFKGDLIELVNIPNSILIIHYLLSVVVLLGFRFTIKSAYFLAVKHGRKSRGQINLFIFGSGAAGMIARQSLSRDVSKRYNVVAFIDDNISKQGKVQDGLPILSRSAAFNESFIKNKEVTQLIIAVQNIDSASKKNIIQNAVGLNLKVKVVPPMSTWIQGELTAKQMKSVKIEDLLERDSIKLDSINISRELNKKKILITGAAGSIGSEILRQVLHYDPTSVMAIDQAESALYDVEMELKNLNEKQHALVYFIVSDVRDNVRMKRLFDSFRPDLVFHAAAYKHVPLMEGQPYEAIRVNVFGTKLIADLSIKFGVQKFVLVSTDKAVNPTNVMGASKRLAEMYVSHLNDLEKTKFITTRFGNVLGSNGSVIPLFRKQIEKGGPLTLTHPEITRFFMTIPEACNLVLEAGSMGNGGEIYVFDMGEPIKIIDLAMNMIRLSGLRVEEDIKIKFTGLRPGEKLFEELLTSSEQTVPTHHEKILIAYVDKVDSIRLVDTLKSLKSSLNTEDDNYLVKTLKLLIPEYKSNNSVFCGLDGK
ncbi:MAG: hypothetical protein RL264_3122 [Bacteroidota bacterium]|jgi:FlaA1/EpsC-like NDP-sugar epimerase